MQKLIVFLAAIVFLGATVNKTYADILTATDGGWSITVDSESQIRNGEGTATEGLVNWNDPSGYDYLYQDTGWGRDIDGATSEDPVSQATLLSSSNPTTNSIALNYVDPYSLYYAFTYQLTGSGLTSTVVETATITNNSEQTHNLSMFKYSDFDLAYGYDAHDNDYAFGDASGITQYDAFSNVSIIPGVAANAFQIDYPWVITGSLNDSNITNLTNATSPFGPADISFAFQLAPIELEAGESYTFVNTKTLTTTPEPISSVLFLLGGGAFMTVKKLRRRKLMEAR